MNQIQQLINQMCPNGVEWKTLGEVAKLERGVVISKEYLRDNAGDYPVYSSQTENNGEFGKINTYRYNGAYVTWTTDGAYAGTVFRRYGKFNITNVCGLINILDKDSIDVNYLYYILSITTKKYVNEGMGNPKLMSNVMAKVKIPLPPLAIQTRIVEILDHFTNLTANLTAELNLRRKQFEHYREKMLSLDGVEMVKLFDVAKNSTGLTYKPSDVSDSGTLVLRSSNIQNSMLCFDDNVFVKMKSIPTRALVKENDILVCVRNGSSSLIGKAAIIDKSCESMAFGAFMTILRAFNINYKYLFYVWQSDRIQKMVHGDSGAPINQITNAVLDKIMIPYPSEDTQHSIVSILDKFTALIENIEKELALRQKQYEYYREELLRFGG